MLYSKPSFVLSRIIITNLFRLFSELKQLFTDNEWSLWPWRMGRKNYFNSSQLTYADITKLR